MFEDPALDGDDQFGGLACPDVQVEPDHKRVSRLLSPHRSLIGLKLFWHLYIIRNTASLLELLEHVVLQIIQVSNLHISNL